jgi:hypothetical protein
MCALKPAFVATSLETLMAKIRRGQREQKLSATYSDDLRGLIGRLLAVDSKTRPSAREVLLLPFLQPYIAEAPATIMGMYDPPSGSTPRLESRMPHHRPPALMVHPSKEEPQEQTHADIMVITDVMPMKRGAKRLSPDKGRSGMLRCGSLNDLTNFNPHEPLPIVGRADSVPDLSAIDELTPTQMRRIEAGLVDDIIPPPPRRPVQRAGSDPYSQRKPVDRQVSDPNPHGHHHRRHRVASPLSRGPSFNKDQGLSPLNNSPVYQNHSPQHLSPLAQPSVHPKPRLSLPAFDDRLLEYRAANGINPSISANNSPVPMRKAQSGADLMMAGPGVLMNKPPHRAPAKDLSELADFYQKVQQGHYAKKPSSSPPPGNMPHNRKLPSLF